MVDSSCGLCILYREWWLVLGSISELCLISIHSPGIGGLFWVPLVACACYLFIQQRVVAGSGFH